MKKGAFHNVQEGAGEKKGFSFRGIIAVIACGGVLYSSSGLLEGFLGCVLVLGLYVFGVEKARQKELARKARENGKP